MARKSTALNTGLPARIDLFPLFSRSPGIPKQRDAYKLVILAVRDASMLKVGRNSFGEKVFLFSRSSADSFLSKVGEENAELVLYEQILCSPLEGNEQNPKVMASSADKFPPDEETVLFTRCHYDNVYTCSTMLSVRSLRRGQNLMGELPQHTDFSAHAEGFYAQHTTCGKLPPDFYGSVYFAGQK